MRKKIIAGNWKMNKTPAEAKELASALVKSVGEITQCDIVFCPPFTALVTVAEVIKGSKIALGAQDMYWEVSGAYTGEISPAMLLDTGCKYVIIGHSERRALFGETNETVNKKVKAAHKHGLLPIMCVGETWEERQAGFTQKVVEDHVLNGLTGLSSEEILTTIIAYEPVWAIGVGKTPATPEQADEVHKFIRQLLTKQFGANVAENVRIQYGGNVSEKNADVLMKVKDIDGGLIGGASLKIDSFTAIVQAASKN